MKKKHGLRRYLRASLRDTWVLAREFHNSLLLFAGLLLLGGLILWRFYVSPETGQRLAFGEALYAVFTLVFFETTIPYPRSGPLQAFFFAVPILGLGVIAEGVIRFGVMLFNKQVRKGEWQVAVASTFRNHIVVCGLGRVGYRVVEQLLRFGEEVVGIDWREESRFVERVREMGVPVIIADAREREALVKAGVPRARALIPCTEDDLTNLAVALDARELKPEIRVVMRMFDAELARKVERGFGIHTAFSTSALAAPAFAAAATQADISHSFYVGDTLLNVSQLTVQTGSCLVGKTLTQLERELDLSVIMHRGAEGVDLHPAPEIVLAAEDCIVVFASLDTLNRLRQLNQP
ncbi:MAG: TrkA family potassium uptake protein [Anaerolineae bacterium]